MINAICYFDPQKEKYVVIEKENHELGSYIEKAKSSQLFYSLKKYLCCFDDNTVFRGQNKDWNPVASIFREEFANLKTNELEYYKNVKRDHQIELGNLQSDFELWSKMQHFGYPTRLLDVTTNIFKSIAFMIDGINKKQIDDQPPCIYIFEPKDNGNIKKIYINEISGNVEFAKKEYPLLVPPNNQTANIRLHAQSGQFIFFDSDCNDEAEYLAQLQRKFRIIKLEVKLNSTDDISNLEKKLKEFGYGIDTLYPDMIKRSEYYKNQWKKNE